MPHRYSRCMSLVQFAIDNLQRLRRGITASYRYVVELFGAPFSIRRIREALAENPPELQVHGVRVGWSEVLECRTFYCDICIQGGEGRFELGVTSRAAKDGFLLTCPKCYKRLRLSDPDWLELNESESIGEALNKRRTRCR